MVTPSLTLPALLVSVRSPAEALAALEGGAALIDVKEPRLGSLGRAENDAIRDIIACVAGRVPVSAALGEWIEYRPGPLPVGLQFVKWGLSEAAERSDWMPFLGERSSPQRVHVAYADWECARAPAVEIVVREACRRPGSVLLIDTHCKTARATLLDWTTIAELTDIRETCRQAGVRLALAGSLGLSQIKKLRFLQPDWFAVRGAACDSGNREASVSADRVRDLAQMLQAPG